MENRLIQNPGPGNRMLMFRGDTITFTLSLSHPEEGTAWLRTNIGNARIMRREIIREVRCDEPPLARDWSDIPMIDDFRFSNGDLRLVDEVENQKSKIFHLTLPLCEVGHFEAKCFFLRTGDVNPIWTEGPNTVINVEPADTCCGNIIYNAFVRQFGPNKSGRFFLNPLTEESIRHLDSTGYTVIPPSGKFRDLIRELDFIIGELGCRIIQLLPINPTPTTYGRMGRFGSPYAAISFRGIDPGLAEFDPKATPLDQFIELADAIHARQAKLIIDIAVNHTGWAARIHETHPEWIARGKDGKIEMPGAWGVVWEDLNKLDYTCKSLWHHMVDVFLAWCARGVDGFRCDAGYMIPVPAWKYIIASVREQYPDTIFFLEGLGGKISVTRDLLNTANFNWAYSELFQNYDRAQIENYLPGALDISRTEGITVHFAETHDNNRLASRSKVFARMRTALCALCSPIGGFAFANGVEWYATEKINVHESPSLNWGVKDNQVDHIHRLARILKLHPAFHDKTELKLIQRGSGNCIVLERCHVPSGKKLLIAANLDEHRQNSASWHADPTDAVFMDLLTEKPVTVIESDGLHSCLLEPGDVLCLSNDLDDISLVRSSVVPIFSLPERSRVQCLRAKALDVFCFHHKLTHIKDFDPDTAALSLAENPVEYCRSLNPYGEESRVITWQWHRDIRREVMIPPNHFLLVRCPWGFRARITYNRRNIAAEIGISSTDGTFFALFLPLPVPKAHKSYTLKISVYSDLRCVNGDFRFEKEVENQKSEETGFFEKTRSLRNQKSSQQADCPLLYLSYGDDAYVRQIFNRSELLSRDLQFLATNRRGGMVRAHVPWGKLNSRYDALLAANLNPDFPEDRRVMFTRCRAWVVFQGYSQEIRRDCLYSFRFDEHRGCWDFHVPTGQGHVSLCAEIRMIPGENATQIVFFRHLTANSQQPTANNQQLPDEKSVQLILRPDIEDRNFHETTKAYMGAESHWGKTLTPHSDGFVFAPGPHHHLGMQISGGDFVTEPEWQYMVHRPMDEERGLDSHSDLFSPGYFSVYLKGGEKTTLTACVRSGEIGKWEDEFSIFDLRFANEAENQKEFLNADLRFANEIKNQETEFFENQKSKIKNPVLSSPTLSPPHLRPMPGHYIPAAYGENPHPESQEPDQRTPR